MRKSTGQNKVWPAYGYLFLPDELNDAEKFEQKKLITQKTQLKICINTWRNFVRLGSVLRVLHLKIKEAYNDTNICVPVFPQWDSGWGFSFFLYPPNYVTPLYLSYTKPLKPKIPRLCLIWSPGYVGVHNFQRLLQWAKSECSSKINSFAFQVYYFQLFSCASIFLCQLYFTALMDSALIQNAGSFPFHLPWWIQLSFFSPRI